MRNDKYLFICSTEYSILNSVGYNINKKEIFDSDIIIFLRTPKLKRIAEKLEEEKIFNNVYLLPFINNTNRFVLLSIILFNKLFLRKNLNSNAYFSLINKSYTKIFVQSNLYFTLFAKIFRNSEFFLLEEGMSSYTGRNTDLCYRNKALLLYKNYFIKNQKIMAQYLYYPDFFVGSDYIKNYKLESIHKSKTIDRVFSYNESFSYQNEKLIYLGTNNRELTKLFIHNKKINIDQFENSCIDIIIKLFSITEGKKKWIYRNHPVEKIDSKFGKSNCQIKKERNMWELECLNTVNDDMMLVSFFSTACITPKLLFNKEPHVIFLYKLLGYDIYNAEDIVNKLRNSYKSKNKINVPCNINELKKIIEGVNYENIQA